MAKERFLSNNHNLPQWLLDAIEGIQSQYDPGEETDFSVTKLLKPPQIRYLEKQYPDDLVEDPSDNLDSSLGTAWHDSVERFLKDKPKYIVERRYYIVILVDGVDYIISAQIDLFDRNTRSLSDHKVTSVYKIKDGSSYDWEFQLNFQRFLMENPDSWWRDENNNRIQNDPKRINSLYINGFARDWRKGESGRYPDYPPIKFKEVRIPIWEDETLMEEVRKKVRDHVRADKGIVRPCTPEERWQSPSKWALMKKGRKSAVKLYDNEDEAVQEAEKDAKMYVEYRPGVNRRCEKYCPVGGESGICPQWELLKEKDND